MAKFAFQFPSGFTLLEVLLAMGIALILAAVAVPAMSGTWGMGLASGGRFEKLDEMVREAQSRGVVEKRPYVIALEKSGVVRLRAEHPANEEERKGVRFWKMEKGESLTAEFPFALGEVAQPLLWTFWPDGTAEAVRVRYRVGKEAWVAGYNSMAVRGEVEHE